MVILGGLGYSQRSTINSGETVHNLSRVNVILF